jgi:katanin p60 ATPase-containing subunit A1
MDGATSNNSAGANAAAEESERGKNIMVLAATNRPQDLDEALRRRLEKRVYIPLPDALGRRSLFDINLKGLSVEEDIDYNRLVEQTEGYSGADMANVCREAAMMPLRKRIMKAGGLNFNPAALAQMKEEVEQPLTMQDFKEAISNIQKSVSQQSLDEYAAWMKEFGSV